MMCDGSPLPSSKHAGLLFRCVDHQIPIRLHMLIAWLIGPEPLTCCGSPLPGSKHAELLIRGVDDCMT